MRADRGGHENRPHADGFGGGRGSHAVARAAGAVAVLAIAGLACSTPTTQAEVWKSPTYAAGPMRNIVVFGGRMDEAERRTLEDTFVSALGAHGVRATPSYAMFPGSQIPDPTTVQSTLKSAGYDGALVSTLKGVSEAVLVAPNADWSGGFYGAYWGTGAPVYAQADEYVKFETSLWNPDSGKMVWSAITQTENPTSGKDFASSLTKSIVPSLAKAGLIPSRGGQPVSLAGAVEVRVP
jgi:hypothetical protein